MIVQPKVRGFVCITSHPKGCAENVRQQIKYVRSKENIKNGPRKALIIGASTGYGLSSRIATAFGSQADTLGVFFERPPNENKPASAGWYNSIAFENEARKANLYAKSLNGDAYSDEIKQQAIEIIKNEMGPLDLVVYSLASPKRIDPKTGVTYKSTLKPLEGQFTGKTVNTDKEIIQSISIDAATADETKATIKVMGGEDWEMWTQTLIDAQLLAPGAQCVAYSYIGPKITWPIYTNGTIGKAKEHLSQSAKKINQSLATIGGKAFISINKAVVTQASSAIPVVPLYISVLFKVMKQKGLHEGCIEQMYRLFASQVYNSNHPSLDKEGNIRMDDWEMRPDVQAKVIKMWDSITTENLKVLTDFEEYQKEFLKLFGFGLSNVDYNKDSNIDLQFKN